MRAVPLLILAVTVSCGSTLPKALPVSSFATDWAVIAPDVSGALARLDGDVIALTVPAGSSESIVVRRKLEVARFRGQRLRLTVQVKTDGPPGSGAKADVTILTPSTTPSYRDFASGRSINANHGGLLQAAIDVAADADIAQLDLTWTGAGTAWFSNLELEVIGPSPPQAPLSLSAQQVANLVSFTQAAALIRYLHPSDEAANLDWDTFLPAAIQQLIGVRSQAQLPGTLRAIFAPIAPTVSFTTHGEAAVAPARGAATHLAHWRQYGFGFSSAYSRFREGRDPDIASTKSITRIPLTPGCKKLTARGAIQKTGADKAKLTAEVLQSGEAYHDVSQPIPDGDREVVLEADVPGDTQAVELGVHVSGRAGVVVHTLALSCDGKPATPIDLAHAAWESHGDADLYDWKITACGDHPCVSLNRRPLDQEIDPAHDILHKDIGNGITIHVPLAVWATADHTFPTTTLPPVRARYTIDDAPMRLATIAAAWSTLSIYYPYFADQHIDWLASLPAALQEAANARSPEQAQIALTRLLAHAHDDHISIHHPATPRDGFLPLSFRHFGDKIIVQGGLHPYLDQIPIGSELLEIQGTPAIATFTQLAEQVSAATEGFRDYLGALRLSVGNLGTFRRIRIRDPHGQTSEHVIPLVSIDLYQLENRDPRPVNGTELAPGILYLDLDALSKPVWEKVQPAVEHAQALVIDLRGYVVSSTADELISHLIDHEIRSPNWQIPIVPENRGLRFLSAHWTIRPSAPKFPARVVVLTDGRAASAAETVLELFHDNHLATLVGETSAGTNGNVAYVQLPAGFSFRFTAMHVTDDAGWTVQGHGFTPDHIVHPTLEALRAGRDEVLQAGVELAQRLLAQ